MPDYKLGWDLQRRSSARYPRMGWDKARISIYSDPIVYEGTITGLRISAVDGTAFIDNAGATIPTYADGNHQIEIYDASNRKLRGVLKAAGTSETLSETDLVTNGTFASDENWDKDTGWTISDGTANASSIVGKQITQAHTYSTNILTKATLDVSSISGGYIYEMLGSSVSPSLTTTGSKTVYLTATSGTYHGWRGTLTSVIIDNYSLKQVLTPSSSGATIVSAKGGETYNFGYKNASFVYNAASYYVIIKRLR